MVYIDEYWTVIELHYKRHLVKIYNLYVLLAASQVKGQITSIVYIRRSY